MVDRGFSLTWPAINTSAVRLQQSWREDWGEDSRLNPEIRQDQPTSCNPACNPEVRLWSTRAMVDHAMSDPRLHGTEPWWAWSLALWEVWRAAVPLPSCPVEGCHGFPEGSGRHCFSESQALKCPIESIEHGTVSEAKNDNLHACWGVLNFQTCMYNRAKCNTKGMKIKYCMLSEFSTVRSHRIIRKALISMCILYIYSIYYIIYAASLHKSITTVSYSHRITMKPQAAAPLMRRCQAWEEFCSKDLDSSCTVKHAMEVV